MFGLVVALLIALLPGDAGPGSRLQSAFSAATPDQGLLAASDRAGDSRRSLQNAKGPGARRPDFGDTPALVPAVPGLARAAAAPASARPALARAQRPGRWLSTARARAPPLA